MSKNIIYLSLIVSIALSSCKKETDSLQNDSIKNDTISEVYYSTDPDYILSNKNAQELLVHLEEQQNDLKSKLKNANKKEAEALYLEYYKKILVIVDSLSVAESNTLSNYYKFTDNKPDSIVRKEVTYDKVGVYFRKVDSTNYNFRIKPGYFYNLFNNKISKEYEEYMKLRYIEHKLLYELQIDGKEVKPEDLRDLIIKWENFITKNKDFKFIDLAKKSYAENLLMYLFGTANKPTFEIASKKIYIENEQEYISFVKKNPKLISAEITKSFLKHFYANDKNFTAEEFYLDLKEFTKKEIADHLK